jgi:hypothetical protein
VIAALDGMSQERAAAIMCAVAAHFGFYAEASRFAQIAKVHRESIMKAGGP